MSFTLATFSGELNPKEYDHIVELLKQVEDPEFNINIVDLGLVYNINMSGGTLILTLTLTTPTCPVGDIIEKQIETVLSETVNNINFQWTFTPLWSPIMVNDEGKEMLKALGVSIIKDRIY
jgi:metal-sulfur cluster biosynthetic enzyme